MAHEALKELILDFETVREQKPVPLTNYAMEMVAGFIPKFVPGAKKQDYFFRDIAICVTVFRVARKFGLKFTRNRYAPRPCACSIVAQAIPLLGEEGVKTIWKTHGAPNKAFLRSVVNTGN